MDTITLKQAYEACDRKTCKIGDTFVNQGWIYPKKKNGFAPPKETKNKYYYNLIRRNGYKIAIMNHDNQYVDYDVNTDRVLAGLF